MGLILLLLFFGSTRTLADPVVRSLANTTRMFRTRPSRFTALAFAFSFSFPFSFTFPLILGVNTWLRGGGRWLNIRWLTVLFSVRTIPVIITIIHIIYPVVIFVGIVDGFFDILRTIGLFFLVGSPVWKP